MSKITKEEIEQWSKEYIKATVHERQYKIYRYCPHLGRHVAILDFPVSECWKCDSEILLKHLQNKDDGSVFRPCTERP